ncbi:MAG: DUF3892 domain-containing protein [Elusimicrobiaceae bacterium]|nr:DUF3892 domain-containing protein [Elusimicrobiaceae bacterium]
MAKLAVRLTHIRRAADGSKIIVVKSALNTEFPVQSVIFLIETGECNFYVQERTPKADVHVVLLSDGTKYIRTDADETDKNNLENLPLF